jgi:hypothetical protein
MAIEFLALPRKIQIKEKPGFRQDDQVYLQFINYFEQIGRAAGDTLSALDSVKYAHEGIRKRNE